MASMQVPHQPSRKKSARDRIPASVRRDYQRILETIRGRRIGLKMTKSELGRRIGKLSSSHVTNIEGGGHAVPSVCACS